MVGALAEAPVVFSARARRDLRRLDPRMRARIVAGNVRWAIGVTQVCYRDGQSLDRERGYGRSPGLGARLGTYGGRRLGDLAERLVRTESAVRQRASRLRALQHEEDVGAVDGLR